MCQSYVKGHKWLILVFEQDQKIGRKVKNTDFVIFIKMESLDYTFGELGCESQELIFVVKRAITEK